MHGEVLGKHPLFTWFKTLQAIRSLKQGELFTLRLRLSDYRYKALRAIKKDPHHRDTAKRLDRVAFYDKQLHEISSLIH